MNEPSAQAQQMSAALQAVIKHRGSVAAHTIIHIIDERLRSEDKPEAMLEEIKHILLLTAAVAHGLVNDHATWSFEGRYSPALFDEHYLILDDPHAIYANIGGVIGRLDAIHGGRFDLEKVDAYLKQIQENALALVQYLDEEMTHQ